MPAVETRGLVKEFRGFRAVDRVDLRVEEGTVHGLVGPNGAGKTTLFNMLSSFLKPTAGQVLVRGQDVTGQPPEKVARLGVGRSFQITRLFEQLTVAEHISLALQSQTSLGHRFWLPEREMARFRNRSLELLADVDLAALADREVHTLPYGQKRALELALVLARDPWLLLLDEPTAGMAADEVGPITALIRRASAGRTVVLVEHNMGVVSQLTDHVTVLESGKILVEGPYDQVRRDPRVVAAYLGEADEHA
ncbi:MAG TPA: ABC transporter ATP-binding protein [Chloroflexota bacterium]